MNKRQLINCVIISGVSHLFYFRLLELLSLSFTAYYLVEIIRVRELKVPQKTQVKLYSSYSTLDTSEQKFTISYGTPFQQKLLLQSEFSGFAGDTIFDTTNRLD